MESQEPMQPPDKPLTNRFEIDESLDTASREAERKSAEDQQLVATWRDALETQRDERAQRKAEHPYIIEDNYYYVQNLIETFDQLEFPSNTPTSEEEPDSTVAEEMQENLPPAETIPPAESQSSVTQEPKAIEQANDEEEETEEEPVAIEAFLPDDLANYKPPQLKFLVKTPNDPGAAATRAEELQSQKNSLQDTLDSFAVDALVYDAIVGPRVTQFRVKPGFGVRVESVASLEKNISLALKAKSVRIEAPIPGEPFIGIEAPNLNSIPLTLRSFLESKHWKETSDLIPLVLGMGITGKKILCDLAKAPHVLIAGATGAGKSVCINNLILSLLYRFRPDELELVLIDPKKVEFALYEKIPHLIHPVVNDPKKACQALKWLVKEMEQRYSELATKKVRNLAGYNAKAEKEGFKKLPFIVLIVDELADLMMTAKDDVESPIARLAQMSRAVGIHVILATQRPSVNVITGVIKANFPTRIAFRVSSNIDSRTILDAKGAESLLGQGDMLYNPPGLSQLLRMQAPYVDDEEINNVVEFLGEQLEPRYRVSFEDEDDESSDGEGKLSGLDPMAKKAIEIIATTGKASTSFIQRKLKIGYNRAANIIEELESRNYIGPQEGSNPREVYVEPGDFTFD